MENGESPNLTQLFLGWRGGNQDSLNQLAPLVADELRRIASRHSSSTRMILHDAAEDRLLIGQEVARSVVRGMMPGDTEERDLSWMNGPYARDMTTGGPMLAFDEEGVAGKSSAAVYIRRASGGAPVKLEEGFAIAISPDTRWVVAAYRHTDPVRLSTDGTECRHRSRGQLLRFGPDGRSLFLRRGGIPPEMYRVDVATGRAELWKKLIPPGPAGIQALDDLFLVRM